MSTGGSPALRGLAAAAGGIAALTALARVAGFARTAVLAGVAGRTCVADAYLTANQLPNVVFEVVAGGALAATVVPLIGLAATNGRAGGNAGAGGRAVADRGPDEGGPGDGPPGDPSLGDGGPGDTAHPAAPGRGGHPDPDTARTLNALLGWVLLLLVPAAVGCALAAPVLARALTGGSCAGEAALVSRLIVVFTPQIPLYGLAVLAAGLLQARHRFTASAAAPLASSLVVVGGYLAFAAVTGGTVPAPSALSAAALLALAGGTTAGVLALALTVVVAAGRVPGTRALRPSLRFPAGRGSLAIRLAGAGLAGVLAAQLTAVLVTVVANHRGSPGSLATYSYAAALYLLPAAVLTTPVTTSVLPRVASAAGPAEAASLVGGSTAAVALLGLGGSAVLLAAAPALGRLFDAGPGSSAPAAGAGVGAVLGWLAVGVPGLAVTTHLTRLAAAARRPGTAAVLGAAGWLVAGAAVLAAARTAGPGRVAPALGAATALGMLAGGAAALLAWSGHRGAGALRTVRRPAGIGIAAAAAGAVTGRVLGSAVLAGARGDAAIVAAGGAAALIALAIGAIVFVAGARVTGLDLPRPGGHRIGRP